VITMTRRRADRKARRDIASAAMIGTPDRIIA
jgi:hypothetical protein